MAVRKGVVRGVLVLVLLLVGRSEAASGIQVLSTEYHVYAKLVGYEFYDITTNSPLDRMLRLDIGAGGDLTDPYVRTVASSGEATDPYAWRPDYYMLHADVDGQRGRISYDPLTPGPQGEGRADTTVTFKPYGDTLFVEVVAYADGLGNAGGEMGTLIEDLTAGTLLVPDTPSDPYGGGFWEYQVDPSHVFQARVWAAIRPDIDFYFFTMTARLSSETVIPAPGALMLAGIGLPMLCWLRRRCRGRPY